MLRVARRASRGTSAVLGGALALAAPRVARADPLMANDLAMGGAHRANPYSLATLLDAPATLGLTERYDLGAGFRIGPAEIEECLAAHPAVADCGVVGVPDPDRGQIVMAVIRLGLGVAGDEALKEALRTHVRERLGGYKVPRRIVFVDELPETSSGKVSRKALRAAFRSDP